MCCKCKSICLKSFFKHIKTETIDEFPSANLYDRLKLKQILKNYSKNEGLETKKSGKSETL